MDITTAIGYLFLFSVIARPSEATISCNFDTGYCGWKVTNVSTSGFQWTNTSGQTNDRTSGPLNDHTCNNYVGQYLFIMGSKSDPNETAILESAEVNLTQPSQIKFWYSMHGINIGSLVLFEVTANEKGDLQLWSMHGNQGKTWTEATVNVSAGIKHFRFQATTKRPFSSDIAIDDIILASESIVYNLSYCHMTTTTTTTKTTTQTPTPTTTARPTTRPSSSRITSVSSNTSGTAPTPEPEVVNFFPVPWLCDFEKMSCGLTIFSNETSPTASWIVTGYKRVYSENDIAVGHNSTGQYYLRFQIPYSMALRQPKRQSSFKTGVFNESVICSFWYNMPHKIGNLQVRVTSLNKDYYVTWQRDSTVNGTTSGWLEANVTIDTTTPFRIEFIGSGSYPTVLGIDDIAIYPLNIQTSTSSIPPSLSTQSTSSRSTTILPTSKLTDKKPTAATTETSSKKTTDKPEKKPGLGISDRETEDESKYAVSSSTIGGLVAGLIGVVVIGFLIYFLKGRYFRRRGGLKHIESTPPAKRQNINGNHGVRAISYVTNGLLQPTQGKRFSSQNVHGKNYLVNTRIVPVHKDAKPVVPTGDVEVKVGDFL